MRENRIFIFEGLIIVLNLSVPKFISLQGCNRSNSMSLKFCSPWSTWLPNCIRATFGQRHCAALPPREDRLNVIAILV